jgi:hypothetical protein
MREIRSYGSVRGVAGDRYPYRDFLIGVHLRSSAAQNGFRILKLKIPPEDHGALDSRLEELINDPDADAGDVISILRAEFDLA